MKPFGLAAALLVFVSAALVGAPATAFFHDWNFSEFFSNADGSVQFIELFTTSPGEVFATNAEIRSLSTGKIFTFDHNLSGSTASKNLLIATPGFASLPGAVTPDFTLPSTDFFNEAGDTLTLCTAACSQFNTIDTKAFSSIPTDGVASLNFPPVNGVQMPNSPRNFAGNGGSVNLSTPAPTGDYNGNGVVDAADYVMWRDTLDQSVTAGQGADGSNNGMIDDADYNFWRARFGNVVPGAAFGSGTNAVPEPAATILAMLGIGTLAARRPRRQDIG